MDRTHDEGDVDLWSVWVDGADDQAAAFALLDNDERARADRFRFRRDRDRYVVRHAFLRRVLAGYVDADPARVDIRIGAHGKPELHPEYGLSFNASHGDGLAVVSVTRGRRVGVDIERLRTIDDAMDVAAGHLTEREVAQLRSTPQASRSHVFLALWTRKESLVKAVGGGLSIPLNSFDCSAVGQDGMGRPRGPAGDLPFAFLGLDGLDGYVGTVTVEGKRVAIHRMDLADVAA